jgi:hypothetical protein
VLTEPAQSSAVAGSGSAPSPSQSQSSAVAGSGSALSPSLSRRFVYLLVQVRVPGGSEDFTERVVVELFDDVVPKTAENFRCLCTGERVRAAVVAVLATVDGGVACACVASQSGLVAGVALIGGRACRRCRRTSCT